MPELPAVGSASGGACHSCCLCRGLLEFLLKPPSLSCQPRRARRVRDLRTSWRTPKMRALPASSTIQAGPRHGHDRGGYGALRGLVEFLEERQRRDSHGAALLIMEALGFWF